MDGGVAARERSTLPAIPTLPALPTAACMVTPEWTSSMQLLLSRVNAPEHKNVLELVRFGRFGTFGVGHAQRSVSPSPLSLLRHDHLVIAALLKKNKAQHRRSRWWQRLEGVRRSLRELFGDDETETEREDNDVVSFLYAVEKASQAVAGHYHERRVPTEEGATRLKMKKENA